MAGFIALTERVWLWFFLLLIPTQLGKHFWPDWSQVMGVRVDYLSVVVYLVDLLWLGLIISKFRIRNYKLRIKKGINFQNILVLMFVMVNILVAENKGIAVYRWFRLFQWWWFYNYCRSNKAMVWQYLKGIIPCWIIFESILGLAQMTKGGSLNGIMYWLGERRFSVTTIGVAQMSVLGQGIIRAYGTFSHPNSMAGFLLVAAGLWTNYYPKIGKRYEKIRWWVVVWMAILGIILSGSRTVWGLAIILPVILNLKFIISNIKKIIGFGVVVIGLFWLVLKMVGVNYKTADFVGGWDGDSLSKRVSLNTAAIKMWRENFMIGVGTGNFIPKLPEYQVGSKYYWLQPVHNIFLLIGAEIGMLGVIAGVWILKDIWDKKRFKKIGMVWGLIIVTGMVDHYWITLPQNSWLLAIVLGVF